MEDRALTTCDSRNAPSTFNTKSCHPLVAFTGLPSDGRRGLTTLPDSSRRRAFFFGKGRRMGHVLVDARTR